jgi:hypothetical protein
MDDRTLAFEIPPLKTNDWQKLIVFAAFLPQMIHIEHPSFIAIDFSNKNQCLCACVPPVSMLEKRVLGAFMPQSGAPRR